MATRAYLRVDPGLYERKALGILPDGTRRTPYTPDQLIAFIGCLGLAEEQPQRGRFRSERILRELLLGADGTGRRYARQVGFLLERGDLVRLPDGRIYVEGWDEWQEGDVTVGERMQRMRNRRARASGDPSVTPSTVTGVTVPTVSGVTADRRAPRAGGGGGGISGGGGGAPFANGAAKRTLSDDEKTEIRESVIAEARAILASPKSSDAARKAARHQLEKLGVDPDEIDFTEPKRKPKAAPTRTHGAAQT